MTEHIRFTSSRVTLTTKPHQHGNEPGLRGFVDTGGNFLGVPVYRAVYNDDPDEPLDIVASPARITEQGEGKPPFVVLS